MFPKTAIALLGCLVALVLYGIVDTTHIPRPPAAQPCTESWFLYLENNYLPTAANEGGPDLGDPDWFSIFEKKAKLPDGSKLSNKLRCQRIQNELTHRTYIINRDLNLSLSF